MHQENWPVLQIRAPLVPRYPAEHLAHSTVLAEQVLAAREFRTESSRCGSEIIRMAEGMRAPVASDSTLSSQAFPPVPSGMRQWKKCQVRQRAIQSPFSGWLQRLSP